MIKTIAIPARLQKQNLTAEEQTELAAFGHQPMTADEISARQTEEAANAISLPIVQAKADAVKALDKSDMTALRCLKAGVTFPAEWQVYVAALRAIVAGSAGPLPAQPVYPAGT